MRVRETRRRVQMVTVLMALALFGLIARLGQMQLAQHARFASEAMAQRYHAVRQDAPRGEILDRHGRKLVSNRTAYRLQLLYPSYMKGAEPDRELLDRLAGLLSLDAARLEQEARKRLQDKRFYEPLLVKDDLSTHELALLVELRDAFPGIYVDTHPVREYLFGDLAAHLLGHVGQVESSEEAEKLGRGYLAGDLIGRMGVERQYDSFLRGTPGLLDLEVDATFRPTGRASQRSAPKPGADLQLTLDLELQQVVQDSLARTLTYVSTHPDWNGVWFRDADVGAAVVMDIRTGAILAMASYPTFNPNKPVEGSFFNRAIGGEYLPGSTWKMLSGAAALEAGVVKPNEQVYCGGTFDKLEPKKDWKPDGHGLVNIITALAQSCNIYFYEMGYRLGVDRLAETAKEFGFGARTGIDLPDEAEGWIPDAARRKADPDPGSWNGGKMLSAAIGQGPTVTPVQLARYVAILANGGKKVKPHVASSLVDRTGKVVRDLGPAAGGRVDLPPDHIASVVAGMKAVTETGTSAGAFAGLPFKVAAKTGTAEVEGRENCKGEPRCQYGVYVAFAPADNPEIAVAVVGERAGHGDSMNLVAKAALSQYFQAPLGYWDLVYTAGILERPAGMRPPVYAPRPADPAPAPPTTPPAPPTTPPAPPGEPKPPATPPGEPKPPPPPGEPPPAPPAPAPGPGEPQPPAPTPPPSNPAPPPPGGVQPPALPPAEPPKPGP